MRLSVIFALGCSANDDIHSPQISAVVPDHGQPGSLVNVTGAYFCQRPDTGNEDPTCTMQGTVYFGTTPGTSTTWNDDAITIEVPQGTPGPVNILVAAAGRTSNRVAFVIE